MKKSRFAERQRGREAERQVGRALSASNTAYDNRNRKLRGVKASDVK
jgi:hypothetical protein